MLLSNRAAPGIVLGFDRIGDSSLVVYQFGGFATSYNPELN
jgi:hypothetical protein